MTYRPTQVYVFDFQFLFARSIGKVPPFSNPLRSGKAAYGNVRLSAVCKSKASVRNHVGIQSTVLKRQAARHVSTIKYIALLQETGVSPSTAVSLMLPAATPDILAYCYTVLHTAAPLRHHGSLDPPPQ